MPVHKFQEKFRFKPKGIVKPVFEKYYSDLFNKAIRPLKNAKTEEDTKNLMKELAEKVTSTDFLLPTEISFYTGHGFITLQIDPTQGQ